MWTTTEIIFNVLIKKINLPFETIHNFQLLMHTSEQIKAQKVILLPQNLKNCAMQEERSTTYRWWEMTSLQSPFFRCKWSISGSFEDQRWLLVLQLSSSSFWPCHKPQTTKEKFWHQRIQLCVIQIPIVYHMCGAGG